MNVVSAPTLTRRPLRAIFFDLDGTLVDSAPDMAAAINELMVAYGLARHSLTAVRAMIGNGIDKLVERAFAAHGVALSGHDFGECRERFNDIYAENLTRLTTPRPGAEPAISSAAAAGLRVGVITNKPEGFSRFILSHFGLLSRLDLVIGGDSGPARKPAPDMLLSACQACRCGIDEAILVGDSFADVAAAKAAGLACIILRGGYTDGPAEMLGADRVIDHLDELRSVLVAAGEATQG